MKLQISDKLLLPMDAQTQTFGILAKRGSGKSYTGMVMAEEMLKAGLQLVAIDPVGVWWGLRSGADGKTAGLPIVIIGGEHADVPLDEGTGSLIAALVIDQRISAVIDVSLLRKNEQKRFMLAFAEELYHRNRNPLHLFLDEADEWAPQKPQKGHERLLGAMEDIVRRGRARGIGATMITQRSAVLNKNVLTQIEVLVALRIVSPQDRDAIEEWITVHGTPEQAKELLGSLASLPIGTAWFWSPGWLDLFLRVKVRKRETFDSSATPEAGSAVVDPKVRAEVDLDALRAALAATIEKSKADDPKELRRQIAELQRKLEQRPDVETKVEHVEVPIFADADRAQQSNHVMAIGGLWERIRDEADNVLKHLEYCVKKIDAFDELGVRKHHEALPRPAEGRDHVIWRNDETAASATAGDLTKYERSLLSALANRLPARWTPRSFLGALSGRSIKSSAFDGALRRLISQMGAVETDGSRYAITRKGLDLIGGRAPAKPMTIDQAIHVWSHALGRSAGAMLRYIVDAPEWSTREQVSQATGYSTTSSAFDLALRELRENGLIEIDSQRRVRSRVADILK